MKKLLLTTLSVWLMLLMAPGAVIAQQASARLECCADTPICAGETADLRVALEGQPPFTLRYSDGTSTQTVSTSETNFVLQVTPATTRQYRLVGLQDARGTGTVCGTATVAVNQCAPDGSQKDCSENCFSSQILAQTTSGTCTTYTLQVNNDGSCNSALSHFNISVPCGQVTSASNSRGWPMEIGTTDPTTGITGLKVDNIRGFGEDGQAGSFTVTYTVCASSCGTADPYCGFLVAYKAGQCVNYGTATPPYQPMSGTLTATPLACYGNSNGSVSLNLTGGQAPYTYKWSNGATTANIASLAAGTYTLTVTDATNRQLQLSTTISQPQALSLQATTSNTSCGSSNGAVDLTVTGGTAPYTYSWSNNATTQDIGQLLAGTYTVVVTDAKGCTATNSYTLQSSSNLQVTLSGGSNGCSAAAITAAVTGGTAPYTYSWNTGETTLSITPAAAGTYTLTVTDAAGCSTSASTSVSGGSTPMDISYEYGSPLCANGSDGWIDLTVTGGSAPYTYSWSNGSTAEDLADLLPGYYNITVTDAAGCTATASVRLPNTPAIGVTATETIQPDCLGNLGGITVSAYNGSAPYTYSWSNGATGASLEGLEPGYYTVTVTDDMGCTSTRTFQIREPNTPSVEISGGSCGNSTLTAVVSGGEGPYSYEWSTGETTGSITGTSGQYYTVIITDQNGCTAEASIQPDAIGNAITISTVVTQPVCNGAATGSVDLTVSGGTGSYTIIWSNGATTEDLSNLSPGTYAVTVTDASGCVKTATVTIRNPAAITIVATETISGSCSTLGGITVAASNGTAPYTYSWSNGATGTSLENLNAGTYTVMVTDANGCTAQKSFTITQDAAPAVSISSTGSCSSQILTAQASGGSGVYTYSWSNGETGGSISPSVSGSYSVTVTDENGCTGTAYAEVTLSESTISLQVEVDAVSCGAVANGAASIIATGGTAPYTYDWSNGHTTSSATNLSAGVYSVRVTDAAGCYDVLAFEIEEAAPISISAASITNSSCGIANGSIAVSISGGTAPYTFKWNTGATTAQLSELAAGSYTLAVIDALGCSAEATFTVTETAGSSVSAQLASCADALIPAGSTASFDIYFEGTAPYTFTYSNGVQEATVTTSSNPYTLTVQPAQTSTYTLLSVSNSCGEGTATGAATVTVVSPSTEVCTDGCFSSSLISTVDNGNCTTYTLQIDADGSCRYDLSHFEIALSCGNVSAMSNSEGWAMSVGLDPTTGVYGIKVDDIRGMGSNDSFTVTYTLCNTESCIDSENYCGPLVAYKAGQCVYYGSTTQGSGTTTARAALNPELALKVYPNPFAAGQVLNMEIENLYFTGQATVSISSITGLKMYEQTVSLAPASNVARVALPNLAPGTYLVVVSLQGQRFSKQLFVY